jgi:C4-dicarboxylate transporter, DctM subunit
VVSAIARGISINQTYKGVLPYVAADSLRLVLVFTFPPLALTAVRWAG